MDRVDLAFAERREEGDADDDVAGEGARLSRAHRTERRPVLIYLRVLSEAPGIAFLGIFRSSLRSFRTDSSYNSLSSCFASGESRGLLICWWTVLKFLLRSKFFSNLAHELETKIEIEIAKALPTGAKTSISRLQKRSGSCCATRTTAAPIAAPIAFV